MMRNAFKAIRRNPAFPSPSALSRSVAGSSHATAEELAALIELDPRATSAVVALHQLVIGGHSIVNSLAEAVHELGSEAVRGLVLAVGMYDATRGIECSGFDHDRVLTETAARGAAGFVIARRCRDIPKADALVCGIVSQIGRVILASVYPDDYSHAIERAGRSGADRTLEVERDVFNVDHHQLAAEVIADWSLPTEYRDAVLLHGRTRASWMGQGSSPVTVILELSGRIADMIMARNANKAAVVEAMRRCGDLGLDHDILPSLFDSARATWPSMASILGARIHEVPRWRDLHDAMMTDHHDTRTPRFK